MSAFDPKRTSSFYARTSALRPFKTFRPASRLPASGRSFSQVAMSASGLAGILRRFASERELMPHGEGLRSVINHISGTAPVRRGRMLVPSPALTTSVFPILLHNPAPVACTILRSVGFRADQGQSDLPTVSMTGNHQLDA